MNKTISIIVIVLVIIVGAYFILGSGDAGEENNDTAPVSQSQPTGTAEDSSQIVVIRGHQLPQGNLEIEAGTTVLWRNNDNLVGLPYDKHTITSGLVDGSGEEGIKGVVPSSGSGVSDGMYQQGLALNDEFGYTFAEPGVYTFYIAEHPSVSGEGKIIVKEGTQATNVENITVEAKSFSFSPENLQVNVGEVVILDISSTGQHTFTIDELGVDVALPHGETTRVEFSPEKTGTFQFYCAIPGHREAGQVGTIVVQ